MISDNLQKELTLQVKHEYFSSYFYLSMAAYCASINYDGFEHFFMQQVKEEEYHIMKFYNYMKDRGVQITFGAIEAPKANFKSIEDVFAVGLAHEKTITNRISHMMDIAVEEKEHATVSFLRWFVDEQVEEEKMFEDWLHKIKLVDGNGYGLLMLSDQAGQRNFAPPASAE